MRYLHILQQVDYSSGRLLMAVLRRPHNLQLIGLEWGGLLIVIIANYGMHPAGWRFTFLRWLVHNGMLVISVGYVVWAAGCVWRGIRARCRLKKEKKRLEMTGRAWFILCGAILVSVAALAALGYEYQIFLGREGWIFSSAINPGMGGTLTLTFSQRIARFLFDWQFIWSLVAMYVIERLGPLMLVIAYWLQLPMEIFIQRRALRYARHHRITDDQSSDKYGRNGKAQ